MYIVCILVEKDGNYWGWMSLGDFEGWRISIIFLNGRF